MKRRVANLSLALALITAPCIAREPQVPPAPPTDGIQQSGTVRNRVRVGEGSTRNVYAGHYGALLEMDSDWTAEARMEGATEVVNFHRKSHDILGRRPVLSQPSDYKAENFAPMTLMELIVIPKNAPGGLRSLRALRDAKENELKRTPIVFEINEVTNNDTWPLGTFHVQITAPYRLWQVYSESPNEFYILTLGGPLKAGDYGLSEDRVFDYNSADAILRNSISSYLLSAHRQSPRGSLFMYPPAYPRGFLGYLKIIGANVRYWTIVATMVILILVPAFWPGKSQRLRRMRFMGRSLVFFSGSAAIVGFLAAYAPTLATGLIWRHTAAPELLSLVVLPGLGVLAAKVLRSSHPKRVLLWTTALAGFLSFFSIQGNEVDQAVAAVELACGNAMFFLFLGLIFGLVFALSFGPLPKGEVRR